MVIDTFLFYFLQTFSHRASVGWPEHRPGPCPDAGGQPAGNPGKILALQGLNRSKINNYPPPPTRFSTFFFQEEVGGWREKMHGDKFLAPARTRLYRILRMPMMYIIIFLLLIFFTIDPAL